MTFGQRFAQRRMAVGVGIGDAHELDVASAGEIHRQIAAAPAGADQPQQDFVRRRSARAEPAFCRIVQPAAMPKPALRD